MTSPIDVRQTAKRWPWVLADGAVLAGLGFLLRGGSEIGLALSLRRSS